jgi:hypothetical protein
MKKMITAILILAVLMTGCAGVKFMPEPDNSYTPTEKALFATMVGCQMFDANSTSRALDRGAVEMNEFVYGSNPTDARLYAVKGVVVLGMAWAANRVPHFPRKFILGTGSLLGCAAGIHNEGVAR